MEAHEAHEARDADEVRGASGGSGALGMRAAVEATGQRHGRWRATTC